MYNLIFLLLVLFLLTPQLTPSESRALNKPCLVMSFYDSHDVWHFLSAGALFLAFMVS